jgi:hypothetical protein
MPVNVVDAIAAANAVIVSGCLREIEASGQTDGARAPRANNAAPSSTPTSVATCSLWSTVRGCAAAARR